MHSLSHVSKLFIFLKLIITLNLWYDMYTTFCDVTMSYEMIVHWKYILIE